MNIDINEKYIKDKLKEKFGELEVYNPQAMKDVYKELYEMIKERSKQVESEDGLLDIQIDNTVQIMRYMLINLTNTNIAYWKSIIDDEMFEDTLDMADGDLKQVIDSLKDIMVEVAQDIRKENVRKMKLLENRIIELTEVFKTKNNIDERLKEFGIDTDTISAIQNLLIGQASKQENENLIENK